MKVVMEPNFRNISIKMEANDLSDQLPYTNFDAADDLHEMIPSTADIFTQGALFDGDDAMNKADTEDIIHVYMDIRDPIRTLKTLLEKKTGKNLQKYEIWLQNSQVLEPHKNLVDQCVKDHDSFVQINAQIFDANKRINIADVVKPTEEVLREINSHFETEQMEVADGGTIESDMNVSSELGANSNDSVATASSSNITTNANTSHDEEEGVNWVVDRAYQIEQKQRKIPEDPSKWTKAHVKFWLNWAVKQFQMHSLKYNDWDMDGKELCALTLLQFQTKVPKDPGNKFWTHLELLRKCGFIAVPGDPKVLQLAKIRSNSQNTANSTPTIDDDDDDEEDAAAREKQTIFKKNQRAIGKSVKSSSIMTILGSEGSQQGNRSGNNGQIQLWQFLLDILTDSEHRNIIQWVNGGEGEFKLIEPEEVAKLWGARKNKKTMNYEKLSRALRYYYDGDMISKVSGKRFVYKFVIDLTTLLGYSAQQLADLVNECPN